MISVLFIVTIVLYFSERFLSIISQFWWKAWCLYKFSAVDNTTEPDCNEVDNINISIRTIDNDRPEGLEGKVYITILDKTNKIPILISY